MKRPVPQSFVTMRLSPQHLDQCLRYKVFTNSPSSHKAVIAYPQNLPPAP